MILNEDAPDKRNYRVTFGKIRGELGFEPKWTIDMGIQQVIESVAAGHVNDYQDPRYSNVKFLRDHGLLDVIRVDDDWSNELGVQKNPHVEFTKPISAS